VNQWKYLKTDDLTNIPTGGTMSSQMQRVHSEITSAIRELQPQVDKMKAHNQKKKVEISQNDRQIGFIKDDIQGQREKAEEYRKKAGDITQANKRLGNEDTQAAADKELLESEVQEYQEMVEVAKADYGSAEKAYQAEKKLSEEKIGDQKEELCKKMTEIMQICCKIAQQDMDAIEKLESLFSG
jgi:chromosome segregation ATPase